MTEEHGPLSVATVPRAGPEPNMRRPLLPPAALAPLAAAALQLVAALPRAAAQATQYARFDVRGIYSWTVPECVSSVNVLVAGGGGGGGGSLFYGSNVVFGGGGGAGGLLCMSGIRAKSGDTVSIRVGAGGRAARSVLNAAYSSYWGGIHGTNLNCIFPRNSTTNRYWWRHWRHVL